MMRVTSILLFLSALVASTLADVYLHSPRGANDRCDEKSNNRNNANRCWDSENNAAGGYGVCDKEMIFYEDTVMRIEFYSQHNCGNGASVKSDPTNPEQVHCMHLLQLGCDWAFKQYAGDETTYRLTDGISLGRPGADAANTINSDDDKFNTFGDTCTQTKPTSATCQDANNAQDQCATLNLADGGSRSTFNSAACQCHPRKMQTYCYHEPEAYYNKCKARERNKGLFAADQNVNNNNGALRTRQEPNSARYGFECVEERDYWPYWHPSPWIDLAVFVSDVSVCSFLQTESQNVKDKCECLNTNSGASDADKMAAWAFNQQLSCTTAGYTWSCTGNAFNWKTPDCILAPNQPDNSLARTDTRGANSQKTDGSRLAHYDWTVDSSLIPKDQDETRCLIRLRYNVSNYETPADYDQNDNYKLSNNPVNTFGSGNNTGETTDTMPIRMAINTAQFGRVFEDRTWSFTIRRRTSDLKGKTIHNLNVRGKRGNIAQVRNCFEYDFVPLTLNANVGDLVFFQWCLTDYNDNGNAGEGRAGTDRVNVVPIGQFDQTIIQSLNKTDTIFSQEDLAALAWIGQTPEYCYTTQEMLTTKKNSGNDPKSCHFLNGPRDENGLPTAYFGYMARVVKTGTMYFVGSRNNNFTNRSQKANVNVGVKNLSSGAVAGAVVGSVVGVAAIAGIGFFAVKKGGLSFGAGKV